MNIDGKIAYGNGKSYLFVNFEDYSSLKLKSILMEELGEEHKMRIIIKNGKKLKLKENTIVINISGYDKVSEIIYCDDIYEKLEDIINILRMSQTNVKEIFYF